MSAMNAYLKTDALRTFNILAMEYEATLSFDAQIREKVAERASAHAKAQKNSKWISIAYGRGPLTYELKRERSVLNMDSDEDAGIPKTEWKWRMINTEFSYLVISPDPSYIEDVEEAIIVNDMGKVLEANAYIGFEDSKRRITYTFNVNVERLNVESFGHLDPSNEGVFSILNLRAKVNFPAMTLSKVFGQNGFARRIILTGYLGDNEDVELFESVIE
jgi:hypothetical protein